MAPAPCHWKGKRTSPRKTQKHFDNRPNKKNIEKEASKRHGFSMYSQKNKTICPQLIALRPKSKKKKIGFR
jgi:hypothetical protein